MTQDGKSEAPAPCTGRRDVGIIRGGPHREITSEELLGGSRAIHIRHAGEIYVLRQTSNGKLIMTK